MRKYMLILAVLILVFSICECYAGLIDYERLKRIRARKAGLPVPQETPAEKGDELVPKWLIEEPKVTSKIDRDYDINRDGRLQSAEVKTFLRDVLEEIEKKGGYTINSDILKEYDKNKDGVVSKNEVKLLKEQVLR